MKNREAGPRRNWECNIFQMDLTQVEYKGTDWKHVAQNTVQWGAL
jgi:hypothetical protein